MTSLHLAKVHNMMHTLKNLSINFPFKKLYTGSLILLQPRFHSRVQIRVLGDKLKL
jgi:hypothetical protein